MCKSNSKIHFCTCASVKQVIFPYSEDLKVNRERYQKTHLMWSLYKYLGEKETLIMGEMILPVDSLSDLFTSEKLLPQLNSKNHFDFEYSPSEGDNLQIRKEYVYKAVKGILRVDLYDYLSFIFQSGKWEEGVYDIFGERIRKFKKGKIKRTP